MRPGRGPRPPDPMPAAVRGAGRCPDTAALDAISRRPAGRRTRTSSVAAVVQRAVQFLQRSHTDVAADPGFDALDGRRGALHGRHAGDVHSYCRRTYLVAVDARPRVAIRSVDHHVDLTGTDGVDGRQRRPARLRGLEMLANLV